MPARKVDIVFCFDASESMKPYVASVCRHVSSMIESIRQAKFAWRVDFVAHHVLGRTDVGTVYCDRSVFGDTVDLLYEADEARFFTKSIKEFKTAMSDMSFEGDENMLYALDLALDFPFGPATDTQRVVILLSDEEFETNEPSCLKRCKELLPDICQKIQDRHITLFAAMPIRRGGMAEELAKVDRANFVALVKDSNGKIEFNVLNWLRQLGQSISSSAISRTSGKERYARALFNQDIWEDAEENDIERIGDGV